MHNYNYSSFFLPILLIFELFRQISIHMISTLFFMNMLQLFFCQVVLIFPLFQLYEDTFPYPKRKEKEKLPEIKKKKDKKKKSSMDTLYILELPFFKITLLSLHVREFGFRNPGNFGLSNPESWKNLLWNPESLAI